VFGGWLGLYRRATGLASGVCLQIGLHHPHRGTTREGSKDAVIHALFVSLSFVSQWVFVNA